MKRTIATLVILFSLHSAVGPELVSNADAQTSSDTELGTIDETVDEQIQTLMAHGDIPSLSVGIVVNDELVWAKNYNGPAGLDSVYIVGSIQKPFTTTAVLQLYEQGLIDLDEDVGAYLPFQVAHPEHPETPITIRMLLTHQSGLGDVTAYHDLYRYRGDYSVFELGAELVGFEFERFDPYPSKSVFFEGLLTPGGSYYTSDVWESDPGTVSYSNIAYDLVGYVVESVSGEPFDDYLLNHILIPLGMDHSGYDPAVLHPFHALPYERLSGDFLYMDGHRVPILGQAQGLITDYKLEVPLYEFMPGAGGLRTTVRDLAQFLLAHMNGGSAPNGFQLLQPKTVALMHQSAGPNQGDINSFMLIGQGMGWSVCAEGVEGHVGGQIGFGGTMVMKRTSQGTIGILLMTNIDLMYMEDSARVDWFTSTYFPLEQLLVRAAEDLLA